MYKSEAFYSGFHDWTHTTQASNNSIVAFSDDMLASIPLSVSLMLLNNARFESEGIAMLFHLLTHLKPYSRENLLLAISDLNHLEMGLGESRIDYMFRV